jgi:hypothetical protein
MSRTRRPTGVQVETQPAARPAESAAPAETPAERTGLGLGWRIAIVVWLLGFVGLLLLEWGGFGWKLLVR